jgi:hypothetical protein
MNIYWKKIKEIEMSQSVSLEKRSDLGSHLVAPTRQILVETHQDICFPDGTK